MTEQEQVPGFSSMGVEHDETPSIGALAGALAKAQGAFKAAPKDSTNPYFNSKYADLASVMSVVREPLAANGLAVTQRLTTSTDGVIITTMLMHASGEWMRDRLNIRIEQSVSKDGKKQAWIQAFGSAVTYARRYALSSMLGVAADEDDDGNAAGHHAGPPSRANGGSRTNDVKAQLAAKAAAPASPGDQISALLTKAGKVGAAARDFVKGVTGKTDRAALTADDVKSVSDALEVLKGEHQQAAAQQ